MTVSPSLDKRKISAREKTVGEALEEGSLVPRRRRERSASGGLLDRPTFQGRPHARAGLERRPPARGRHRRTGAGPDRLPRPAPPRGRSKTLLLVTYDEHGGFFDHVPPPPAPDDDPHFETYGVRVPALVVSPFVAARSVAKDAGGERIFFDHTSIIKTILLRHCLDEQGTIPDMGKRVSQANHLGQVLGSPRGEVAEHTHLGGRMTQWRSEWATARYADPQAKARWLHTGGPPTSRGRLA